MWTKNSCLVVCACGAGGANGGTWSAAAASLMGEGLAGSVWLSMDSRRMSSPHSETVMVHLPTTSMCGAAVLGPPASAYAAPAGIRQGAASRGLDKASIVVARCGERWALVLTCCVLVG